ncbi:MAG: hypothetical protein H7145_23765 [Akkermansiaceae bacterium]|nr:hypothetical protein [Armatimonadota bacterium]
MSPDQLLATSNTGHWQIPGVDTDNERVFKGGTIVWDDLRRYQNPGVVPGSQTLRFPSPEVLCLIHCAHAFRSALMRLHLNSLGGERLNELLTIRSLTHLPAFDKVLFEKLMHGWGASDAVQFINLLTTSFLGSAVLPGGIPHDVTRLFPEQLPYGGWVSLQSAHDFLFPRGIEQIMAQLDAPIVALPFAGNVSALPRLLLFGEQRTDPHIEIAWQDRETLLLHWTFAPSALANEGEIVAHFGADSFVRVRTQGGAVAETEQKGDFYRAGQRRTDLATVQVEARQSVVTIVCPVPALPPPITGWLETTLPLMLSFRAASEGDAPAPVYYIPLRLQPFRARPNAV